MKSKSTYTYLTFYGYGELVNKHHCFVFRVWCAMFCLYLGGQAGVGTPLRNPHTNTGQKTVAVEDGVQQDRKGGGGGRGRGEGGGGGGGGGGGKGGGERDDVTTPAAARTRASLVNTSYVPEVVNPRPDITCGLHRLSLSPPQ